MPSFNPFNPTNPLGIGEGGSSGSIGGFSNPFGENGSGLVGGAMEGLFGSFMPAKTDPRSLYGEGYNTLDAYRRLAPEYFSLESQYRPQMAELTRQTITANLQPLMAGTDPAQQALLGEMNSQALSELKMGATLDPSLRNEVMQSARAGQAARGLGLGPSDVYAEAMQIGSAGQALRNQRRAYAGQVSGLNIENLRPYLGLVSTGMFNQPYSDMWSPYAADLYNTNFNAESARNIAGAANRAAVTGAMLGAAGNIGGSLFGG